ncbi:hypothetical protein ACNPQM_41985 [Streptomyces sp. NPDC056231]|uniref:hypothetical protein n=1 Tax=Streptomyces sp. NPDC056231 TaxID=3345755 RepID=UPI003AAEA8E9
MDGTTALDSVLQQAHVVQVGLCGFGVEIWLRTLKRPRESTVAHPLSPVVQGLRSGCCPDLEPAADDTVGRHLIRSHHYKNVTDDDGNHVSDGEEREVPWVAITPVVQAIRVLERMVPERELLLSAAHHDFPDPRGYHGTLKNNALNNRIERFVARVNHEAEAQGLP